MIGALIIASLGIFSSAQQLVPADSDAVVAVYAIRADGKAAQGTGFFVNATGEFITSYHVVLGAKKIVVYHKGSRFNDIMVLDVIPDRDLARLRVLDRHKPFHRLLLGALSTDNMTVSIPSWPRDLANTLIRGTRTSAGYQSSRLQRGSNGDLIFLKDFELVPFDATVYGGMSGAPVIGPNGVIGVLAMSWNEGGSLAWAIPLPPRGGGWTAINKRPDNVIWPDFTIVKAGGVSELKGNYHYSERNAILFENVNEVAQKLDSAVSGLKPYVATAHLAGRAAQSADSGLLRLIGDSTAKIDSIVVGALWRLRSGLSRQFETSLSDLDTILESRDYSTASDRLASFKDTLVDAVYAAVRAKLESEERLKAYQRAADSLVAVDRNGQSLAQSLFDLADSAVLVHASADSLRGRITRPPLSDEEKTVARAFLAAELEWTRLRLSGLEVLRQGLLDMASEFVRLVASLHEIYIFEKR